jgi:translation initiation factor IF-2
MADAKKPVRLSKAAKEFNLGIGTIVEFLESKGIQVEAKPNTKLDPEVYALVRGNFQGDKDAKEAAKRSPVSRERESISIESAKKQAKEEPVEDTAIDLSIFKKDEPGPKAELKIEEPAAVEKPLAEHPVVEEAPAPETTPEPESVVEKQVAEEATSEKQAEEQKPAEEPFAKVGGLKVVGKVDFEAQKKEAAEKRATAAEARAKAKLESEKIVVKSAIQPVETTQSEAEDKKDDSNIVKAKAEQLTGPKVVGKIELPVEKPKKSSDGEKRKRVRVKKVDVNKQARANNRPGKGKKVAKKGGYVKKEVSQEDIQKEIRETLARLSGGKKSKSSKLRREKRKNVRERSEDEMLQQQLQESILKMTEFVTVAELASMMNKSPNDVISACMMLGIMVSINQRLDSETITMIAEDFGFEVEFISADLEDSIEEQEDSDDDLQPRPPIVTVMGHVDHGKTSLLDYVRKANVIEGEAGGITQHIGSYSVKMDDGKLITFLDTPGHEAFTAMRARGAQVTDLAIIVVASDDAVMPQTKEAIHHAQAAGIPMIIALNKMDKETANPDKIKKELSEMNILVEEWGGKYQCQEISAKRGTNIDELLEKVLLDAEMLDLKANPNKRAVGTVVESTLDKGRGYVTNILVQAGTLRVGDAVLAGQFSGKIKAMFDERGARIKEAGPSTPVSVLGFDGAPSAGDNFNVFEDEKEARSIANKRQQLQREQGVRTQKTVTLEELGRRIAVGEFKELNLIVKGDVDGSIEALSDSLQKLSTEKVQVNIIHKAVGQITESDVLLASASSAYIIGFQVRPSAAARKLAETEQIQIKLYSVIYKAIEEMRDAMEGLLSAKIEENIVGTAEIRETFKISKIGTIAGCFVTDGKIFRSSKVRVLREGIVVYTGLLGSLKRFKDDTKEVSKGYECGLNIDKFNDIKVGDIVEAYEDVEVKQTLDD